MRQIKLNCKAALRRFSILGWVGAGRALELLVQECVPAWKVVQILSVHLARSAWGPLKKRWEVCVGLRWMRAYTQVGG